MADNIDVTPGTGKTVKTTDVAGEQIQHVVIDDVTGTEIDWTAPVDVLGTGTAGTAATGVVTVQGITSMTPVQVSQATATNLNAQVVGEVAAASTDSGNPVKIGAPYNSTKPTYTNGQRGNMQLGSRGALVVQVSDPDGATSIAGRATNADGVATSSTNFALQTWSYGSVFNGTTWDRQKKASTVSRIVSSANSTNATAGKASAGDLHVISCQNTNAAVRYLKLYNKASAPTVGTDTPIMTIALTATSTFELSFPNGGLYFSTGIAYALTTGSADADTGAVGAGDILGLNVVYA